MSGSKYFDSSGKPISVGDYVRWRGQDYWIVEFHPGQGRSGCARIQFDREPHIREVPDEWGVDKIDDPIMDLVPED
jgi:hypothetical protein